MPELADQLYVRPLDCCEGTKRYWYDRQNHTKCVIEEHSLWCSCVPAFDQSWP